MGILVFSDDVTKIYFMIFHLDNSNFLQLPSTNTLIYGNDSQYSRGAILWDTLSDSIKCLAVLALRAQVKSGKVIVAHAKICR